MKKLISLLAAGAMVFGCGAWFPQDMVSNVCAVEDDVDSVEYNKEITPDSNFSIKSSDFDATYTKAGVNLHFSKEVWNDWCDVAIKVTAGDKVKFYLLQGEQVGWDVTAEILSVDEDGDPYKIYILPQNKARFKSSKSYKEGVTIIPNYEIIEVAADEDITVDISKIGTAYDWTIDFYCYPYSVDDSVTMEDPDGTANFDNINYSWEDGTENTEPYVFKLVSVDFTEGEVTPEDPSDDDDDEVFTYGDYRYIILDDGTVEITGYTGEGGDVVIPGTIDDKKVTSIGGYAFYDCTSLTSIVIPDGVTSIGDYAFAGCTSLESISIPDGITSIGEHAFNGCENLTSVLIPDSVATIGFSAFSSCDKLANVKLPNSITNIDGWTFAFCSNLSSIIIPDSVTSIGDYAFSYGADITIYAAKGTAAESYATKNKFTFVDIESIKPGDANGDGTVDLLDVMLMQQYIAKWDVDILPFATDYDGDNEVTIIDVMLTQQKIVGWEV